jgi:XTP/dITP diphosphohydrolase
MKFVLASANPDKAKEIRAILEGVDLVPLATGEQVEETGLTLEDNARLKARAAVDATGMAAVADDTGLEVEALGGAPGVYSARYAGPGATYADNVGKLLNALRGETNRRARFRTVAIACWPDGREVVAEGAIDGSISEDARGEHGFGYDPVFVPDEGDGRTFAELGPEVKQRLSHRSRAFRALAARLPPS